jgi:hypothetical protein
MKTDIPETAIHATAWPGTHPAGRLIEPRRGLTESFGDHTRKPAQRFFSPLRAVFTASVEIISL